MSWAFRLCAIAYLCLQSLTSAVNPDCSKYKQEWFRTRYSTIGVNVLNHAPPNLAFLNGVCPVPQGSSCCDRQTESEMYSVAQFFLTRLIDSEWVRAAEQMGNDSLALEMYLRANVEQTRDRSHEFFSRIYGYNYKAHKRFFLQFFADLEAYVMGQRNQLSQLIDNFFNELRDSIVALIERSGQIRSSAGLFSQQGSENSNPGSTDETAEARRIRCLSDRMAQLRPFDDVDVRLKTRMMEAYPPARMLVHTLLAGNQLLSLLFKQISTRPECAVGLARFQLCAVCAGKSLSSVCPASCPKLMSACLPSHGPDGVQLSTIWPRLIDAILMTCVRLERSFNFPAVNRHLQMEISEAITSLQTRYEQSKSKFESECRVSSTGRNAPSLFTSPSSSAGRNHFAGSNNPPPPTFPDWSRSGFRRHKRSSPQQSQQFGSYPASPDLLDWQTRQLPPMSNAYSPVNYAPAPAPMPAYGTYGAPPSNPSWTNSNPASVTPHNPDNLVQLTSRMKRTYSALKNLFANPVAKFCPSPNSTVNTTDCWNPPDLTNAKIDQAMSETLQFLSAATDRLTQAATESSDPEIVPTANPSPIPTGPHIQPPARQNEYFQQPQPNEPPAPVGPDPWGQQAGQNSFLPHGNAPRRNEMGSFGSGFGDSSWSNYPNQQVPDQPTNFYPPEYYPPSPPSGPSPPGGAGYRYAPNQPPEQPELLPGSGVDDFASPPTNTHQWPPEQPNTQRGETNSQVAYPNPQQPVEQPSGSQLSHSESPESTMPPVVVHQSSTEPSLTTTTTNPPRLTTNPISEGTAFETQTITNDTVTPTLEEATEPISSTFSREPATTSQQVYDTSTGTRVYHSTTTPSHVPVYEPRRPTEPAPSGIPINTFSGPPDDEDTAQQPRFDLFNRPTPPPPPFEGNDPLWPTMNGPDNQRQTWYQPPQTRPDYNRPFGPPGNVPPPLGPETVPSYYPHGSGQAPGPAEQPFYGPQTGFDPPGRHFPEQPPGGAPGQSSWSSPYETYPAPDNSGWVDTTWPSQGSGHYDDSPPSPYLDPPGVPFNPSLNEPVTTTTPPPPPTNNQPTSNRIFLPPPEIWVPAQMGPGHRFPSMMLVREYDMQNPYYRPDFMMQHHRRNTGNPIVSRGLAPVLCLLLMLHAAI